MVEEHPVFIAPENIEIKVWRYMDFTKMISLIDTRRLFFTRADLFSDPFEGSYPKINVEARNFVPQEIPEEESENYLEAMKKMGNTNKHWPRYTAISCWHMNEYESAAMWSLYLKSDEGIAVQSTYKKLKKSIIDDNKVYLGIVKYIDYEKDYIDAGNLFGPFVHKRKSFEHERELRGVLMKWPKSTNGIDFQEETIAGGVPIKVDIEELIEKIYVAPNAPRWFVDLVKTAIKRYGYNIEVIHSELSNAPMF
ncbi:MAG: hypothetical protein KBB37_06680 [Bacteroidia bacterium]|nr:hypothetical protein [Bacteroidia bacterium]MBP7260952.1 hypothetical protein [Bacteroidia bacterium]MBP9180431.1 hypothetical protein [Bacteroidia bacterium]MBP9723578.1 hypothetical protein [Bacteroidia bacterium]